MNNEIYKPRSVCSFVRRLGRMTTKQRLAIRDYWPKYGVNLAETLATIFPREAPLILEIGFGMGSSLLQMAKSDDQSNYLGIEVHQPGIGALMAEIAAAKIENLRIIEGDAVQILQHHIPDASLQKIMIFFPDPWPKRKHHKRRLIQTEFIELIQKKLQHDGYLHIATDWQDYAQHTLKVMQGFNFENIAGEKLFMPSGMARFSTKFEHRGLRLGHQIYDMVFRKSF